VIELRKCKKKWQKNEKLVLGNRKYWENYLGKKQKNCFIRLADVFFLGKKIKLKLNKK